MGSKELTALLIVALLTGCGGAGNCSATTAAAKPAAAAVSGDAQPGEAVADDPKGSVGDVILTVAETRRLGIMTSAARPVNYTPMSEGFGVVLSHDLIAQLAADVDSTAAAAVHSKAALERARRLAGGPGALGSDVLESATRQVSLDETALVLARRKLTATLGLQFPTHGAAASRVLETLANGTAKLARITFPPGSLEGGTPGRVRVASFDSTAPGSGWTSSAIWDAPQDPSFPGRTVFALLETSELQEGARLQALPVTASGTPGVVIPATAVIVSDGQYWCYLEKQAAMFVRTPVDVSRPFAEGYFVASGIESGAQVVTRAAGLLLARQTNPASAAAD